MGGEREPDLIALAAGGSIASGVSAELVRPLRELRDALAVVVEHLDRHVSESSGPTPLPWDETRLLREKLAASYLTCRSITRLTSELAAALARGGKLAQPIDINNAVETAISISRHRISARTEFFIDLGDHPVVKAPEHALILLVAHLICIAADSARGAPGAAISIKTRRKSNPDGVDYVSIYVADNGTGAPDRVADADAFARDVVGPLGGSFSGTSEPEHGSVFDVRVPIRR